MKLKNGLIILLCIVCLGLSGCSKQKEDVDETDYTEDRIKIGLSFDSFVIERWQRDRDIFVQTANDLGADVNVQNANGDLEEQISQIEYFIKKKMDVIVVIAVDSEKCSYVMRDAIDAGIKVIAYDRLIKNANADLYISFDNEEVGRLMAQTLIDEVPEEGNIITIFGPTTDYNVLLVEKGFMEIISNTDLKTIHSVYAEGWLAETAFNAINEGLKINEEIDGVLCGNDNLASQAVRALSENRMAGKVCVTGQDADLAACQRIVEGTQTMTVYKPVDKLAKSAAEYAIKLAKNEEIDVITTINDGSHEIPYVKLQPIAVTKDNMYEVIIGGGFQQTAEVYLNAPEELELELEKIRNSKTIN